MLGHSDSLSEPWNVKQYQQRSNRVRACVRATSIARRRRNSEISSHAIHCIAALQVFALHEAQLG